MSEWKKVKLRELYNVHNGLSKGRQFFGSGFPFLTFSNVFNNWFLPNELESLVQSSEKERQICSIKRGDVFITRTSETMNELGMSSVALKDYPNATYNGFTKRLRPITDEVLPEYIGYYLRSPKFRGKFMAFSTMTTRASLANDDLLSMEVDIPEKVIQQRIATILSRYDSLIENYQKQIKLLEESAQRLYKEWFIDFRFPDHENTKIVDGVPERWEKKCVDSIYSIKYGKNLSTKLILSDLYNCADGSIYLVTYNFIPLPIYASIIAEVVLTISSSSSCKKIVLLSGVVPKLFTSFPATII
jgi:type I restriction enzyme S subunit